MSGMAMGMGVSGVGMMPYGPMGTSQRYEETVTTTTVGNGYPGMGMNPVGMNNISMGLGMGMANSGYGMGYGMNVAWYFCIYWDLLLYEFILPLMFQVLSCSLFARSALPLAQFPVNAKLLIQKYEVSVTHQNFSEDLLVLCEIEKHEYKPNDPSVPYDNSCLIVCSVD